MILRRIEVNGTELSVKFYGSINLPAIVMIHGWPENNTIWNGLCQKLKENYYIICPDLRGMGESERDLLVENYSKDNLALDLIELMQKENINNPTLIGHDWGGAIAQEIVFANKILIKQLVVIGMFPINNIRANMEANLLHYNEGKDMFWYRSLQVHEGLAELLLTGKEKEFLSYVISKGSYTVVPDEFIDQIVKTYLYPYSITTAANFYRSFNRDKRRFISYRKRVVQTPTTFIYGENDPVIRDENFKDIHQLFPHSAIIKLSGSHFLTVDNPNELFNIIKAIL